MIHERLRGITTFVHVVEAGGFAQAAVRLSVTRSAVGKTIARLEQRLGVRLLHRTTRKQSLTDDGQAYYEHCLRALAELDAAEAAFDSSRSEPIGRLRVSAPVLFGRHCIAPVLRELVQVHPRLELELSCNDRLVDLVEEGVDLAVRIGGLVDRANLVARRLGTQNMGICAAPSYLEEHGSPETIAELMQHAAIVYSHGGRDVPWRLRDADGDVQEVRPNSKLRLDDLEAIEDAAVAGVGLAWLPCWLLARHVQVGDLALVMDSERVMASEIHVVWPANRHLPSKTRVAIDTLVREVPRLLRGAWEHARQDPTPLKSRLNGIRARARRGSESPALP